MGFPAQLDEKDLHFPDEDSVSHFAAKEMQIFLRVLVVLSIVAFVVTMATFWFFAWIPLLVLLASVLALVVTGRVERGTRNDRMASAERHHREERAHELHPDADNQIEGQLLARDDEHFTPWALLVKESVIGLEIIIGLGLAAVALVIVALATNRLEWELVSIGVGLIVVYGLFVMAPVWLGLFTDVDATERGKASNEHVRPSTPKADAQT